MGAGWPALVCRWRGAGPELDQISEAPINLTNCARVRLKLISKKFAFNGRANIWSGRAGGRHLAAGRPAHLSKGSVETREARGQARRWQASEQARQADQEFRLRLVKSARRAPMLGRRQDAETPRQLGANARSFANCASKQTQGWRCAIFAISCQYLDLKRSSPSSLAGA